MYVFRITILTFHTCKVLLLIIVFAAQAYCLKQHSIHTTSRTNLFKGRVYMLIYQQLSGKAHTQHNLNVKECENRTARVAHAISPWQSMSVHPVTAVNHWVNLTNTPVNLPYVVHSDSVGVHHSELDDMVTKTITPTMCPGSRCLSNSQSVQSFKTWHKFFILKSRLLQPPTPLSCFRYFSIQDNFNLFDFLSTEASQ